MDPKLLPFVSFSEDDTSQEAPQIRLEMKLYHTSLELSITSPIRIHFTLRREQDRLNQDCIFVWSLFKSFACAQFVLLHQKGDVFEQVNLSQHTIENNRSDEDNIMKVNGWNDGLQQLSPGSSQPSVYTLRESYHKVLIPGERYRLIWPGGEFSMWDWGSKRDHVGKELKSQEVRQSKLPRLILPACAGVEFTAMNEAEPWPGRAEWEAKLGFSGANAKEFEWWAQQKRPPLSPPISPSQRVLEAPVLNVSLESDGSRMTREGEFAVTSRVTYEKPVGAAEEAKPIIFHIYDFHYAYRLCRLRKGKWERCEIEEGTGFIMVDLPDEKVKVSQHKHFVSLRPGESWTTQKAVQDLWTHIPNDSVVGDTFRYNFKGATLDWWDWGDGDETEVVLPCFHWASVIKPADNDGRPKLVVPGSNTVEFSIMDDK